MTLARRSPFRAVVPVLGLLVTLLTPAAVGAAGRPAATAERWIVAVARDGGSAIGRRGAWGPAPRVRAVPGDPAARRQVRRLIRTGGIRPSVVYRHAFDGFAAALTPIQLAALRRDPAVVTIVPDRPTRLEAPTSASVRRIHLDGPVTPTGIRRARADHGPLSRIDGVDDRVEVDVAIIDTGIFPSPELRIAGGRDCSSDDPDAWRDREGHGTHVAGAIGARDDRRGVVGVAPGARLWAIKIFDDEGSGLASQQLCGLDTVLGMRDPGNAARPRIEVVNLSMGQWLAGYDDRDCGRASNDLIHGAICALVADGTTVVAAAGNQSVSTTTRQPAAYDEVITVSALADFDGLPGGLGRQADICPGYSPELTTPMATSATSVRTWTSSRPASASSRRCRAAGTGTPPARPWRRPTSRAPRRCSLRRTPVRHPARSGPRSSAPPPRTGRPGPTPTTSPTRCWTSPGWARCRTWPSSRAPRATSSRAVAWRAST